MYSPPVTITIVAIVAVITVTARAKKLKIDSSICGHNVISFKFYWPVMHIIDKLSFFLKSGLT